MFVTEGRSVVKGRLASVSGDGTRIHPLCSGASAQIKASHSGKVSQSAPPPPPRRVGQRLHFTALIRIAGKPEQISQQDLRVARISANVDQNKLNFIFENT